jgi:hypothetical protein
MNQKTIVLAVMFAAGLFAGCAAGPAPRLVYNES